MKEQEFPFYLKKAERAEGILKDLEHLKVLLKETEKQLAKMKRQYQKSGDTVVPDEGRALFQRIQYFKEKIQQLQVEYKDSVKADQEVRKSLQNFEGPIN